MNKAKACRRCLVKRTRQGVCTYCMGDLISEALKENNFGGNLKQYYDIVFNLVESKYLLNKLEL